MTDELQTPSEAGDMLVTRHSSLVTNDPAAPILLFEQVTKWYGPVIGVNHVSLELRGGITGLVGANGAGKSTLLRLATGQLKPSLGKVSIHGVDAWDWQAKRHVGYCPSVDPFYDHITPREFAQPPPPPSVYAPTHIPPL